MRLAFDFSEQPIMQDNNGAAFSRDRGNTNQEFYIQPSDSSKIKDVEKQFQILSNSKVLCTCVFCDESMLPSKYLWVSDL